MAKLSPEGFVAGDVSVVYAPPEVRVAGDVDISATTPISELPPEIGQRIVRQTLHLQAYETRVELLAS